MRFHVAMINDVALRITPRTSHPLSEPQVRDMASNAGPTFDIGRGIVHESDPNVNLDDVQFRLEVTGGSHFQADLTGPEINYPQAVALAAWTMRQSFILAFGVEEAAAQLQQPVFAVETVLSPDDIEAWCLRIGEGFTKIIESDDSPA